MSDYISREALTEAFENADADVCERFQDGYCDWGFGRQNIGDVIASVPTADVEPVRHGRWMHEETEGGFHIWSCSRCGRGMNGNPNGTNLYCYHCGAKMDLEGEIDD